MEATPTTLQVPHKSMLWLAPSLGRGMASVVLCVFVAVVVTFFVVLCHLAAC